MEVRVDYSSGSGSLNMGSRFTQVSGDEDDGVFETAGYHDAENRVTLSIDQGSGSFTIR